MQLARKADEWIQQHGNEPDSLKAPYENQSQIPILFKKQNYEYTVAQNAINTTLLLPVNASKSVHMLS